MAFRTFCDTEGEEWDAYDVSPVMPEEERRQSERRADGSGEADMGRRTEVDGIDRRVTVGKRPSGRIIQPWLCFEHADQRRRLMPVPENWSAASDEQLEQWRLEAKPAQSIAQEDLRVPPR